MAGTAVLLVAASVTITLALTRLADDSASTTTTSVIIPEASADSDWVSSAEVTAICQAAKSSASASWCFRLAGSLADSGCGLEVFREGIEASRLGGDKYREALFLAMEADGCAQNVPEAQAVIRADELRREFGGLKSVWLDLLGSSDCGFLGDRREQYQMRRDTAETGHIVEMYTGYLEAIEERITALSC